MDNLMLDCHCHLLDLSNLSDDFFHTLGENNINKIYCNTVNVGQWSKLTSLAAKYPEIIPFYGIHPWHINETTDNDLELLALFLEEKKSFCGEIGLDRFCETDLAVQEEVLKKQLDIAFATKSFVAIHCVKAWGRLFDILAEYQGGISFMLHSFQGSREVMERLVAMGGMISFSHRVMDASQQKLQDVLRATPLENLLLETDFPFHNSETGPSATAYCQALSSIYTFVSGLRRIPASELAHIIENNGSICTY